MPGSERISIEPFSDAPDARPRLLDWRADAMQIGRAIARTLASEGASVIAAARNVAGGCVEDDVAARRDGAVDGEIRSGERDIASWNFCVP